MNQPEIPVSRASATPLNDIAKNILGLRLGFVNVFGVGHADGSWTLIDAGIPYSAGYIRHWAEQTFGRAPIAIVLTHGHFDHVSAAPSLAETWNIPVYAHAAEEPYLTGRREYPPPKTGAGGGLMSLLSPIYPRGPVNLGSRLRLIAEQEYITSLSALPEWQIIHTPGHTDGHISLFRPADQALLVGDAFCTTKPESFFDAALAQPPELNGPPAYFTSDFAMAANSIRRLAMLQPRIIAPGHGRPLTGVEVSQKLSELATRFAADAVRKPRLHVA